METTNLVETQKIPPSKAVVRPSGRMDVGYSPNVRQTILDIADQGVNTVIVDLSLVEFMDSSGLSALVSGMKTLRKAGGMLSLCSANSQIRTALRLTMLDRVFPMFEDINQALLASSQV
jgi:anti-anti-sigma factor